MAHPELILRVGSKDDILRQVEAGDLLTHVAVRPDTQRQYQFPVNTSMPERLVWESNPYLQSLIYQQSSFNGV